MTITVSITYREALNKASNWDDLCSKIGLNPWCINEGLVDGEDNMSIDIEIAKKYGLLGGI